MVKLKQIIEACDKTNREFNMAIFAGFERAKFELNSSHKVDRRLGITVDPQSRVLASQLIAEIEEQYLKPPYSIGLPRENFKGNWREYVAFRCGEFVARCKYL